jgi:GNAT superfamily N-acetyltransferase
MAGGLEVRRASADDVQGLAEVHLRSALTAYADMFPADAPKPTVESLAAHWHDAAVDPASEVFVAEAGEAIIGGVIATTETRPGVGNLRHLYVDPAHWGSGAGRALHDAVVAWCAAAGLESVHLWVLEANDRARVMYERWGWSLSVSGRFVNEGSGVREVLYVLDRVAPP